MQIPDELARELYNLRDRAAVQLAGHTFNAIDAAAAEFKKFLIRSVANATRIERNPCQKADRAATRPPK